MVSVPVNRLMVGSRKEHFFTDDKRAIHLLLLIFSVHCLSQQAVLADNYQEKYKKTAICRQYVASSIVDLQFEEYCCTVSVVIQLVIMSSSAYTVHTAPVSVKMYFFFVFECMPPIQIHNEC